MRKIDFLPESYRESCRRRAARARRAWLAGLVLAVLASWFAVEEWRLREVRSQLEYLARQNKTAMAGLEHIANLQTEQAALLDRHRLLQELQSPVSSVETMFRIARLLPENMALKQMQMTCQPASAPGVKAGGEAAAATAEGRAGQAAQAGPRGAPRISLWGVAASQVDVGVLVGQLSGCREFANVRLDYSKAADVEGRRAQEFRVTFDVAATAVKTEDAKVDAGERALREGVACLHATRARQPATTGFLGPGRCDLEEAAARAWK
jgi:hypothetical protein